MTSTSKTYSPVAFHQVLPAVNKPSRYTNREINSRYKFPSQDKVNFCLAFPDLYEVGFSHLGLKILYSILNEESDATADRVYAPWLDFAIQLREKDIPLFSLENGVALKDYDIIGFTLQSELSYSNLLLMLDLARIPIIADERSENDPLIIAGGLCSANPEPLAIFIDLFFIGEAEEGIIEIKNMVKKGKDEGWSRKQTLENLQTIDGVYVPSLYKVTDSGIEPISDKFPSTIRVRKYSDFSKGKTYSNQLVSWQQATHDRYITEIMRGCSRGCRFCFAGFFYRPVRERSVQDITKQLLTEVRQSGWEEAALLSLSSADYTCIKPLLIEIYSQLAGHETELSLPSLRVDSLDDDILKLMNSLRQNGVTIAPEAGSQRLRDVINKDISEEQILELVKLATDNGWKILKLYFMIGLPGETEEDIEEIGTLIDKIVELSGNKLLINITISPFVPKPHTPFQWVEMLPRDLLLDRIYQIKRRLSRNKRIKIKYHDVDTSFLEAIICRGNRDTGKLIHQAYLNGAQFDGWNESFNLENWTKSAETLSMALEEQIREIDIDTKLPWDHINTGINKSFLISELENARNGIVIEDCRHGKCTACEVCNDDLQPVFSSYASTPTLVLEDTERKNVPGFPYRIRYAKKGLLRFVSHLDTLRMMHRLLRMSGLPIVYTQGYNKHPKIQFGPPLSVGIEGKNELLDIELDRPLKPVEVFKALNNTPIADWEWLEVSQPDLDELPKLENFICEKLTISYPEEKISEMKKNISGYFASSHWLFSKIRKGKTRNLDLKDLIYSMEIVDDHIQIVKKISGASIYDILTSVFKIAREDTGSYKIVRQKLLTGMNHLQSGR